MYTSNFVSSTSLILSKCILFTYHIWLTLGKFECLNMFDHYLYFKMSLVYYRDLYTFLRFTSMFIVHTLAPYIRVVQKSIFLTLNLACKLIPFYDIMKATKKNLRSPGRFLRVPQAT